MPSYALNQFVDLDDVLCKHLLNLDLREPAKIPPHAAVGYRKPDSPCTLSSSGSGLSLDSMESGSITPNYWGSQKVSSQSKWSKTPFWSERSVSMVEGNTGSLGWSSAEPDHLRQPLGTSGAGSLSSSTSSISATSSRYKTELCRTFAERGVCKYGAKCQFAHGLEELRDLNRHPKYKTEPCRTFHSIGFCPYGIRCHFVHNAEDDQMHSCPHTTNRTVQRPPLLKQSFSFSGFPTTHQPLDAHLSTNSFLRAPSVATPTSTTISDLLSLAFPHIDASTLLEQARDINPQFLPSPDSGCSNSGLSPTQLLPSQTDACLRQSPTGGASLGLRSLSHTSLSDHEGGSCSSSSSMSGSESSFGHDGSGRRLPIFSQLSVPDDVIYSESSNSSTSFFL
ncbi:mRNA decay activator protein ZFP36L1 [Triplophysa rosa]|uniref:mRNA decay activator protein ZFP36 n=1 Tax=Triplophysa rosa TaxID=992332 RepID=A0A9W7TQG8_TRIRA|nr:mRNA decay activator protein ZFP36L1 [Triplophysa rosa]KAI7800573.1 putative zinc finger protein 36 [Triplophysa rosa]